MDNSKQNINVFLNNLIEKIKKDEEFNINNDLQPKMIIENSNELRIKKNLVLRKILNKNNDIINDIDFKCLYKLDLIYENDYSDIFLNNESILRFWRSITKKVENKEVLNFPMCVNLQYFCKPICNKGIQKYSLYFIQYPELKKTSNFLNENIKENLFQKLIIFYTLDTVYNLSSDSYEYEYFPTGNKLYTYKIKDLIFTISIKNIIILSPRTKLIKEKLSINDYINQLSNEEKNLLKTNIIYENFYELLLENFFDYFEKKIYNTKNLKQIMELSYEIQNLIPGNIYILSKSNLSYPVYVLVLYVNETHIKYLILFDSTIQKTLSMSIKVINKNLNDHVFFYPDLLFEKNYFQYTIGFN